MLDSVTIAVRPVSLNQDGPFHFNITPKGDQYIQLNMMRLYVKGQVRHVGSGSEVSLREGVGVCNLLANSLIQNIEIEIGGKLIGPLQNTNSNYKTYMETFLSYSNESKKGHLAASGWEMDSAAAFDDVRYAPPPPPPEKRAREEPPPTSAGGSSSRPKKVRTENNLETIAVVEETPKNLLAGEGEVRMRALTTEEAEEEGWGMGGANQMTRGDTLETAESEEEEEEAGGARGRSKREEDQIPDNTENKGLVRRRANLIRPFDYMIPLHCDFLSTDRFLPPGVELSIKLTRAKDSFVLMLPPSHSGLQYTIKLTDVKLFVPYVTVDPSIVQRHISLIQEQPVLLPLKKTEISVHHFGAGASNVYLSNLFQNRLPKTLIMGMLPTENYNGTPSTNPYHFKHFSVNHVQVIRNGVAIPNEPYTPDWSGKLYNRELRSFFDNIGIQTDNLSCGMTSQLYSQGATLFAWDFTPDKCNGYHWHRREAGGTMDLSLKFKDVLPQGGMTVMLFAVYDALVAIDKDNQVSVTI